jgi:pectin methylesterase-like acyl-CoA thioesterase
MAPILCMWMSIALALTASATQYDRASCQRPTDSATPPAACPPHTLLVGPAARFKTIQSAVRSIPAADAAPYTILVQPGVYAERVNVTRAGPLTLLGATAAPGDRARNAVTVLWRAATGTKQTGGGDNAFTAALTVAPTLDASLTGAGPTGHAVAAGTRFGNGDFRAYNVDFVNDFAPRSAGPSLAVSVSYANAGFYYCRIRSYQDTVSRRLLGLGW